MSQTVICHWGEIMYQYTLFIIHMLKVLTFSFTTVHFLSYLPRQMKKYIELTM